MVQQVDIEEVEKLEEDDKKNKFLINLIYIYIQNNNNGGYKCQKNLN